MYHQSSTSINSINKITLFILLSFVFILVNSSIPQPDESFSSNVLVSTKNGSNSFSVYGKLYISYPLKRRLDYTMYYGPLTVVDRCDLSPMVEYTAANETCFEKKISNTFGNMWGWLQGAVESGNCINTSQSGKQYTATFTWGIVMGCFSGDLPLERVVTMYSPFSVQVITFFQFNAGTPSSSTFLPPDGCYGDYYDDEENQQQEQQQYSTEEVAMLNNLLE